MIVHDLSIPISDGVDWYGDPTCAPVELREIGSIAKSGWRSTALSLMVLNGTTYLETAAHIDETAPTLDQIPPEKFITRAFVVRLHADGQQLHAPERAIAGFKPGVDAILLNCGWCAHLNDPDYYRLSPYFSPELQAWLLDHRPAILGGDMLSFDHPQDTSMPFIRAFFKQRGMILCPLTGLDQLPDEPVTLCAAPTKLAGASAAPCRALAW